MAELILPIEKKDISPLDGYTFSDGTFVLGFPDGDIICRPGKDPSLQMPQTEASDPFSRRVELTEKIIALSIDPESEDAILVAKSRGIKLT